MLPVCAQQSSGCLPPQVPVPGSKLVSASNLQVSPEYHAQPVAAPNQEEGPRKNVPEEVAMCRVPDGAGRQGHCCFCCAVVHVVHVGLGAE